jgi:hypothetical protein
MKKKKRLWFRRKAYGWGWYPVTWEGWVTIALFVLVQLWNALRFQSSLLPTSSIVGQILIVTSLSTGLLLWICLKTGETPKWQWGAPRKMVQ